MKKCVITSAARTAVGSYLGTLKTVPVQMLAGAVIKETMKRSAVTIVPEIWILGMQANCRVFQDMTAQDIVESVLKSANAYQGRTHWALANAAAYKKREYCVQYHESDLAFIGRLLQDEGIFFCFQFGKST